METTIFPNIQDVWIIANWGYPLLFLAMMIEGPFATMAGAFLASVGAFRIEVVYPLSIIADMTSDIILYYIGYFGGIPVLSKAEKLLKVKKSIIERIEEKFEKNGAKIIFFVKVTTGLAWITFILAGAGKMRFESFLLYSFLGGVIWSGILSFMGYFFGYAIENIDNLFGYFGFALFFLVFLFFVLRHYICKKI